jgi:hypothetical protein
MAGSAKRPNDFEPQSSEDNIFLFLDQESTSPISPQLYRTVDYKLRKASFRQNMLRAGMLENRYRLSLGRRRFHRQVVNIVFQNDVQILETRVVVCRASASLPIYTAL